MTRYVAFLGGINVGGHRVAMERLRAEFEALGYDDVGTFIASGNVLFTSSKSHGTVEKAIEAHLERELGYGVPTFVRTAREVGEVIALAPFGEPREGYTHLVGFLDGKPGAEARTATAELGNERETLEVHGAELHWLIHGGHSDTHIKPRALANALGQRCTTRNVKSLGKLAARLADEA